MNESKVKFCPYCGSKIDYSFTYCPFCGKRLITPEKPKKKWDSKTIILYLVCSLFIVVSVFLDFFGVIIFGIINQEIEKVLLEVEYGVKIFSRYVPIIPQSVKTKIRDVFLMVSFSNNLLVFAILTDMILYIVVLYCLWKESSHFPTVVILSYVIPMVISMVSTMAYLQAKGDLISLLSILPSSIRDKVVKLLDDITLLAIMMKYINPTVLAISVMLFVVQIILYVVVWTHMKEDK